MPSAGEFHNSMPAQLSLSSRLGCLLLLSKTQLEKFNSTILTIFCDLITSGYDRYYGFFQSSFLSSPSQNSSLIASRLVCRSNPWHQTNFPSFVRTYKFLLSWGKTFMKSSQVVNNKTIKRRNHRQQFLS